jgi:hypothetical protein
MFLPIYLSIILGEPIRSLALNILKGNDFVNDRIRFSRAEAQQQIRLEMMATN